MFEECSVTKKKQKKIQVGELKRKLIFDNPELNEYEITQIDGCVITEGRRCDVLVSEKSVGSVLVEFKGCNIQHACDQLITTAEDKHVKTLLEPKLGFVIVCSRYPRFDTYVAKAKTVMAKRYKAGLTIFCDQREVSLQRLVKIA